MTLTSGAIQTAGAYVSITRTVAGGKVDIVDASGSFVACLSSSQGSFAISLDGQPSAFMAQGIKVRSPIGSVFKNVIIDNTKNAGALLVTLAIGIGDVTDARFNNAEPLDAPSVGGNAYMGGAQQIGLATKYTNVGWWNPTGSGKTALMRTITFSSDTAQLVAFGWATASFNGGGGTSQANKLGGAAINSALLFSPDATQTLRNLIDVNREARWVYCAANQETVMTFRGPLAIAPNSGVALWPQTAALNLAWSAEWNE
jgi:hypothetical protein